MPATSSFPQPAGADGTRSRPGMRRQRSRSQPCWPAKFPRARWPILAAAVAIAASRIFRGSHYLTDVAGGAALGCVMGVIAAHPWREWRSSAGMAVCRMTPFFVATLALVWTIVHLPSETWPFQQLLWGGLLLTLAGLVGHVLWTVQSSWCPAWLSGPLARGLVGLGLGMTTGSLFVTTIVLLVCVAHWLDGLPWSDRVHGGWSCGVMGGHDRGSVRRGHAAGAGGELCPERHRADVVWFLWFVVVSLAEPADSTRQTKQTR